METTACTFKFATLCDYLDRIRRISRAKKFVKQLIFNDLLAKWSALAPDQSSHSSVSFYPIMRIMANSLDDRKFNMKTKKLIAKVCKVLHLPVSVKNELMLADSKSSSYAIRLLANKIAERNPVLSQKELSIFDINESLNRITEPDLSDGELEILMKSCSSSRQLFWLLNILVRNIERALSITASQLINWLTPRGSDMRQAGTTLECICQIVANGKQTDDSSILFRMFEPMLLARLGHSTGNVFDKLVQFCGEKFFVELKYDGEHFLLHKGGNGEIRYFSRAQNDFTTTMAPIIDPRINEYFSPTMTSCILDIEMLLWDTIDEIYVGKGRQASDGRVYDVKYLKTDSVVEPCVVVFDILFFNGQSLMDVPLNERLKYLNDGSLLRKTKRSVIFVSEIRIVDSREQFTNFYENAVSGGEEGVVVKKIDSLYKTGVRQMINGWFKVKPFHLGDESLDLAVVGVDRGRSGRIYGFSVAVLREDKYFMVGKVGSGLDKITRNLMKSRLMKTHGFLKTKVVPEWIHPDYLSTDLPTNFVHRDNFQVVEVQASGLINGRLHVPFFKFFREDKLAKDIDKYEDFLDYDKNLRANSIANIQVIESIAKRKKALFQVPDECRLIKTCVEAVSEKFKGKQFCVLKGNEDVSAKELQEVILSFGGSLVANPGKETFLVISVTNDLKCKSIIKSNKYNVIGAEWILACKNAGKVLPISRSHAVHVVDDSIFNFFCNDEISGVPTLSNASYYTIASVSALIEKIKVPKRKKATAAEAELRKKISIDDKFERFHRNTFFIHSSLRSDLRSYARILLKMHGGNIVNTLTNSSVNYIVVDNRLSAAKALSRSGTVIDIQWLENVLEA